MVTCRYIFWGHGKITKQPFSHRSDVVLRIGSLSMFIPLFVPSLYIPISQVLARFLNHQISTLLRILGIKGMELDVAFGFVWLRWCWNHTVWDDLEKPDFRYSITSTIITPHQLDLLDRWMCPNHQQ